MRNSVFALFADVEPVVGGLSDEGGEGGDDENAAVTADFEGPLTLIEGIEG